MLFGHNSNVKVGDTTFHVQTEDRGATTALIDTTVYYMGRVMHRRTNNYHDLVPLDPDREEALRLRLNEQHRATMEDIRTGALHLAAPPQSGKPAVAPVADETTAAASTANANTANASTTDPSANAAVTSADHPAQTPQTMDATSTAQAAVPPASSGLSVDITSDPMSAALNLELCNARAWLSGKQARLEISVATHTGQPLEGAKVAAYVEGAAVVEQFTSETNAAGKTEITFAMPKLAGGPAALVIEAERPHGEPMSRARAHAKLRFALRTKPRPA